MTLLLGKIAPAEILIFADGVSTENHGDGTKTICRRTLQKVFPFNSRPIAIAHHGENLTTIEENGTRVSVKTLLERWIAEDCREPDVQSMARKLMDSACTKFKGYGGFWIAGFDNGEPQFFRFEVNGSKPLALECVAQPRILDGCSAGKDACSNDWTDPQAAFDQARPDPEWEEEREFGGIYRILRIHATRCEWIERGCDDMLDCETILGNSGQPIKAITKPARTNLLDDGESLKRALKKKAGRSTVEGSLEELCVTGGRRKRIWRLVGIHNEARRSSDQEVSIADATVYRQHVQKVIEELGIES